MRCRPEKFPLTLAVKFPLKKEEKGNMGTNNGKWLKTGRNEGKWGKHGEVGRENIWWTHKVVPTLHIEQMQKILQHQRDGDDP